MVPGLLEGPPREFWLWGGGGWGSTAANVRPAGPGAALVLPRGQELGPVQVTPALRLPPKAAGGRRSPEGLRAELAPP